MSPRAATVDFSEPLVPAADVLASRLAAVFADPGNEVALRRLSRAQTTVCLRLESAPEHSVTLLLDRRPPELARGVEPAEVTFVLTTQQAHEFAHGRLKLALEVMAGTVTCTGAVRRYLALDAILRHLLATA